jgi:hypothetical protein
MSNLENFDIELSENEETENEPEPIGESDAPNTEPQAEELLKRKKARHFKPFTEEKLTSDEGLLRIYTEFPKIIKFGGRGSEAKDIKKLMTMYKEWAYQMHRGIAFADMIAKCETFGSKGRTRACLQQLRDQERDRYLVSVDLLYQFCFASNTHHSKNNTYQYILTISLFKTISVDWLAMKSLIEWDGFQRPRLWQLPFQHQIWCLRLPRLQSQPIKTTKPIVLS